MKRHVKAIHLNLKIYKCAQCNSAFSTKRNLKSHVDLVHLKTENDTSTAVEIDQKTSVEEEEEANKNDIEAFPNQVAEEDKKCQEKILKEKQTVETNENVTKHLKLKRSWTKSFIYSNQPFRVNQGSDVEEANGNVEKKQEKNSIAQKMKPQVFQLYNIHQFPNQVAEEDEKCLP